MALGSLIIGGGKLIIAAEIATWCFNTTANSERQYRNDFVRSERANRYQIIRREKAVRRDIERETRRHIDQEAYEQRGAWLDMRFVCPNNFMELREEVTRMDSHFPNGGHALR